MEWQAIDSAPKDEDVLFYGPDGVDIGCWQDEQLDLKESGAIVDPGMPEGWFGCRGYWPGDKQPTHWMPLPAPPEAP